MKIDGPKPDEPNNVIPFDPGRDRPEQPWLRREYHKREKCHHLQVVVSAEDRRCYCGECDVELDPIAVLLELAHKERNLYYSRKEVRRYEGQVQELKREERRVKARLRRAQKRLAETEDMIDATDHRTAPTRIQGGAGRVPRRSRGSGDGA